MVTLSLLGFLQLTYSSPFNGSADIEVVHVQVAVEPEIGLGKLEAKLEVLITSLSEET